MIARSSAGLRPGLKSTSQPRSAKISTARGDSSSEMRTLGLAICGNSSGCFRAEFLFDLAVGPVEPRQQRLEIALLDGGAAPDAQSGRGVAIGADVVARLLGLQQIGHLLGRCSLLVRRERGEPRRGDVEAYRGVGTHFLVA